MKQFLAIYTGTKASREKSDWDSMDPDKRQKLEMEGIEAWGGWMKIHEKIIVVAGGPLGKTKQVSKSGVSDITNAMAGYIVIKAASHEEAAKLFLNHPHFSIFPGDAVEIMECLPIPGMA